jgi:hypothetical protein
MKVLGTPKLSWLALAGLGLALAALANACGGGGGLSAEQYFQKLQAIVDETVQKESAAVPSEEEAANLTLDEQKQARIEFLTSFVSINEEATGRVENLNPPDDIQDAHDDLVAAAKELTSTFRDLADQAQDIAPEDIEDFFNTQVFGAFTSAEFDEACSAVQDIADDKGIDVDLNCEPEE